MLRWSVPLLLLLAQAPVSAQEIAGDPPVQWQADAKANKKAEKVAEKAARKAMPKRHDKPADGGPKINDDMGGPAGGGGPDGPGGGPGDAPPGGRSRVDASSMLRPEMDFAAPVDATLLLYRTREALVFGRSDSQDVVVLPLSGSEVQVAPGFKAAVSEKNGKLGLDINTSNEIHVHYDYLSDPNDPGTLTVKIIAEGYPPGAKFEVQRSYHRAIAK